MSGRRSRSLAQDPRSTSSLPPFVTLRAMTSLKIGAASMLVAAARSVVAPPPHWTARVPCNTDDDCVLNGVCVEGACLCDRGWKGRSCEALALLPAPVVGAYGVSPNMSSWGCSVLRMGDTYHVWVSEFWGGCGNAAWEVNSHVIHAFYCPGRSPGSI